MNLRNTLGSKLYTVLGLAIFSLTLPLIAAAQTINGCADKANGQLRRIVPPAVCKANELAVNWNAQGVPGVQGIQGVQGVPGVQGIQGEPGASGAARLITVGTGFGTTVVIPCAEAIRTKVFVKQSETSSLRITYHDSAFVGSMSFIGGFDVAVRIDGAEVAPTPLENSIRGGDFLADDEFTTFGYAYGIAAGTHTLTTHYDFTILPPTICYRTPRYTIEVEEIL